MKSILLPLLALACCAACGPSVVPGDTTSGTTTGGGQAGTAGTGAGGIAGSSGTGGVAGATGGTGGTAGSAGIGGLGGFGSGGTGGLADYCAATDFYFDIAGDGPDQHYDIKCQPQGYILLGGGPAPHPAPPEPGNGTPPPPPPPPMTVSLHLDACPVVNTIIMSAGGSIDVPGTSDTASFQYKVGNYGNGTLNITEFGDVGQAIVGDYGVTVMADPPGSPTYKLTGTFRVCRTPDIYLP